MNISLVPVDHVLSVWGDVRGYLEPAVATANGRWTMEHLCASLATGRTQLWIGFDDERIWGCLTTEVVQISLGGKEFDLWYSDLLQQISRYGKDMGCDGIEGVARFGFWKWLKQDGFEKTSAFYEKGMKNG